MRILIVYATRHGHTEKVVRRIADVLRTRGAEPHVLHVAEVPRGIVLRVCDAVVIAGSVYFGRHSSRLAQFVMAHRDELSRIPSAFVSVSGAARSEAGRGMAEESVKTFLAQTGWTPGRVELVAGGEPFTRYGFFTKWFMKRHAKKQGRVVDPNRDYDLTDWPVVDRFAESLIANTKQAELATV